MQVQIHGSECYNERSIISAEECVIFQKLLFLNITAPDYIAPLYETVAGRVIMTAVCASSIGIYAMIRRIVSVEI